MHQLQLEPQQIPASNVIFVRSIRATGLAKRIHELSDLCWPFHQEVIAQLGVRVVLCFGKVCGQIVCEKLKVKNRVDKFVEKNNRRWVSEAFMNTDGFAVIIATHPSIADWTAPATDPSQLVQRILARVD